MCFFRAFVFARDKGSVANWRKHNPCWCCFSWALEHAGRRLRGSSQHLWGRGQPQKDASPQPHQDIVEGERGVNRAPFPHIGVLAVHPLFPRMALAEAVWHFYYGGFGVCPQCPQTHKIRVWAGRCCSRDDVCPVLDTIPPSVRNPPTNGC